MTDQIIDAYLDELEALASAATPGPWASDGEVDGWMGGATPGCIVRHQQGSMGHCVANCTEKSWRLSGTVKPVENAAYIAAANPQTMLRLVSEIRRLRSIVDGTP